MKALIFEKSVVEKLRRSTLKKGRILGISSITNITKKTQMMNIVEIILIQKTLMLIRNTEETNLFMKMNHYTIETTEIAEKDTLKTVIENDGAQHRLVITICQHEEEEEGQEGVDEDILYTRKNTRQLLGVGVDFNLNINIPMRMTITTKILTLHAMIKSLQDQHKNGVETMILGMITKTRKGPQKDQFKNGIEKTNT
jgi:hypothetical protein